MASWVGMDGESSTHEENMPSSDKHALSTKQFTEGDIIRAPRVLAGGKLGYEEALRVISIVANMRTVERLDAEEATIKQECRGIDDGFIVRHSARKPASRWFSWKKYGGTANAENEAIVCKKASDGRPSQQ